MRKRRESRERVVGDGGGGYEGGAEGFRLLLVGRPVLVEVPEMRYLAVDGEGILNTAVAYREAVEALYAVAYGVKFARTQGGVGPDYVVMPLEGLWWLDGEPFTPGWKERLTWTMLIRSRMM